MQEEIEIYLDMDGVCVDFMGAAIKANGFEPNLTLDLWRQDHPGSIFPETLLRKPAIEFFNHEHISGTEFWRDLVEYPWFDKLYTELGRLGHVMFLTAPTSSPGCVSGKHEWLNNKFGYDFNEFIFTRHKDRLAHPNAYLVDDMPFNTEPFNLRRGNGALFPQIWNDLHDIAQPAEHLIEKLDKLIHSNS